MSGMSFKLRKVIRALTQNNNLIEPWQYEAIVFELFVHTNCGFAALLFRSKFFLTHMIFSYSLMFTMKSDFYSLYLVSKYLLDFIFSLFITVVDVRHAQRLADVIFSQCFVWNYNFAFEVKKWELWLIWFMFFLTKIKWSFCDNSGF